MKLCVCNCIFVSFVFRSTALTPSRRPTGTRTRHDRQTPPKEPTNHPLKLATTYLVVGGWKESRRASSSAPNMPKGSSLHRPKTWHDTTRGCIETGEALPIDRGIISQRNAASGPVRLSQAQAVPRRLSQCRQRRPADVNQPRNLDRSRPD